MIATSTTSQNWEGKKNTTASLGWESYSMAQMELTNGAESAGVKIHPSRFCPIWRLKIKSPIRPACEEVALDLTVHSDIFLVVIFIEFGQLTTTK
jgi:hypothetical protein